MRKALGTTKEDECRINVHKIANVSPTYSISRFPPLYTPHYRSIPSIASLRLVSMPNPRRETDKFDYSCWKETLDFCSLTKNLTSSRNGSNPSSEPISHEVETKLNTPSNSPPVRPSPSPSLSANH